MYQYGYGAMSIGTPDEQRWNTKDKHMLYKKALQRLRKQRGVKGPVLAKQLGISPHDLSAMENASFSTLSEWRVDQYLTALGLTREDWFKEFEDGPQVWDYEAYYEQYKNLYQ